MWNMVTRAWSRTLHSIPEPRWTSGVYAVAYALFVATGAVTLVWPPQSLEGVFGQGGMIVVGLMFTAGGVAGMWSGWREWWEMERWAVAAMLCGVAAYAYIVFSLQFTSGGSRLTQGGVILIAACLLILRIGMIWRYPYKPRG